MIENLKIAFLVNGQSENASLDSFLFLESNGIICDQQSPFACIIITKIRQYKPSGDVDSKHQKQSFIFLTNREKMAIIFGDNL